MASRAGRCHLVVQTSDRARGRDCRWTRVRTHGHDPPSGVGTRERAHSLVPGQHRTGFRAWARQCQSTCTCFADKLPVLALIFVLVLGFGIGLGVLVGGFALVASPATFGAIGLAFGLGLGLVGVPDELSGVSSPWAAFRRDRQVALLLILAGGLPVGLLFGFGLGWEAGTGSGLVVGLVVGLGLGLVAAFVGGCALSMSRTQWPSYMLARGLLAGRRQLPWQLMDFLADAHTRGVLRQAGAVYQFRHIELQHRLANRDARRRILTPRLRPRRDNSDEQPRLTSTSEVS